MGQQNRTLALARPYNADEAESHGIEFAAGYQLNDQWKFSGNYTWTKGELTDALGKKLMILRMQNMLPIFS